MSWLAIKIKCYLHNSSGGTNLGLQVCILDILFRQITTLIKVHVAFVFGLQTLGLIDFTRIFQLKGLKPNVKGQTIFL